jgi:hypothetical protein
MRGCPPAPAWATTPPEKFALPLRQEQPASRKTDFPYNEMSTNGRKNNIFKTEI